MLPASKILASNRESPRPTFAHLERKNKMKRNALSVTAIVFLGLFLAASVFIFVFERQLVSYSATMETDAFFSTPFVVPWESAVLIAAAVFEIIFTAKGGKRIFAAVPLAAVILGRIAETIQIDFELEKGAEMVSVISIVNAYSNFVTPLFVIGSGFMFVCAFSDYASKKLLYTGTALVSFAAAAVIILLFPFSAAKAVNAAGYIVSAGLLILAAVKKTNAFALAAGIFCALHTAARPFISAFTRYFIAHFAGEDELTNFWISNIYAVFAGVILTVGAVMILSYCANNS